MEKEKPLWQRIYCDPVYTAVAREIGYQGCLYRDLLQKIETLSTQFDKVKVESAVYHLAIFEGQMTVNPKPLAEVKLRDEARKLCWQLLGYPPEYIPTDMIGEIMAAGERLKADPASPAKKPASRKTRAKKKAEAVSIGSASPYPVPPHTTPHMQQYQEAKERHPDMLLLFRIGDFYELFDADAQIAAKELGLTVTTRDRTTVMAGFPHHSLETYLRKLLGAGHRVAICEQVEASLTKDPIQREVTRVVTPGTTAL